MINFLNLEYFLVAAEELNFTRAAKRLYITQQSLSNHISNLEKEFDIILFHRTTPLTLTYAGKTLQARAKQLLKLKEETMLELSDIKDFSSGQLVIGVSHTRGRFILPEILPIYKERFPNIELTLVEGNSNELDQGLLHGEIDLIIGMLPFKVDNIETVRLCAEEILLAIPDSILERAYPGQLQSLKKQFSEKIDFSLLKDCPFLLIKEGNHVRNIANQIFEEAQICPKVILETENIETVLALTAKGMGITFYPKMFISGAKHFYEQNETITFYSLSHANAHGVLAIGYHKGHYMSQATKEFIQIVKETI